MIEEKIKPVVTNQRLKDYYENNMMARKLSFAQGSINRVQNLFKAKSMGDQPSEDVGRFNFETSTNMSARMRTSKLRGENAFEESLLEAISPQTKVSIDALPVNYDHTSSDKSLV